ncbi:DUF262 domain-containing protein [Zobellia barbeyronii]|uniref:DUF262 domain-containing protein n=1 Tax=Zobellia barbeyronii TaxID=2748009 RepID=A0ABS5WDZ4_9FLAO|nr:DUF262 domain-containing protein [Zobellia barbeyronii]MBT2161315.1 DUF262 domain-containing protein [Zobellia barbeyronii]
MGNNLKELTIGTIFLPKVQSDIADYVIPRYQRNYAWKQPQVVQMIQDIYDFATSENSKDQNYYIGTLVVYERSKNGKSVYETIDGQQRLTTLNILFSVLKNEFKVSSEHFKINLSFDSRPLSSYTLEHIFDPPYTDIQKSDNKLNTRITDAYVTVKNELNKIQQSGDLDKFISYLKNKVILLRAPVPYDTNLNHYFEIMNNRGEQLEKHEVLKAQMLKVFQDNKKATKVFSTIWEACANMEKYVQYGFSTKDRTNLFGEDWNQFKSETFGEIINCFKEVNSDNDESESILSILDKNKITDNNSSQTNEAPDRFSSIINFSNFLLHILRVLVNTSNKYTSDEFLKDVPLDDKRLLDTFKVFLDDENNKKDFVEEFAHLLLKGKHYFDKYIIKRNLRDEKWSLKYLKVEYYNKNASHQYINSLDVKGSNKQLLMLLSMFHFSTPTLVYKHWLNAALNYVLKQDEVDELDYINYLEDLSDSYLYDRFLSHEESSYFQIIYNNDAYPKNRNTDLNKLKLHQGTGVENFIFNRLDYLLWKNDLEKDSKTFSNFYFTLRTSVEHYYPQNPNHTEDKLDDSSILNNFGNLCLISNRKNSQLNNALPEIKKGYYKDNDREIESLKQRHMMNDYTIWRKEQILDHGEKMRKILLTTRI